jgi:hypothetical protein
MDSLRHALLAFLLIAVNAACGKSDSMVQATGKVEVHETFPKNEPGNKIVGVLNAGESAPVLATRHSKEFMFYRIRLADGREGYVMFGDDFKVEQKSAR